MEGEPYLRNANRSDKRLGRIVLVISLFCLIVVWIVILWNGIDERQRLEKESRDELLGISQIAAEQTRHIMLVAKLFLKLTDNWIMQHPEIDPCTSSELASIIQILRVNMKSQVDIRLVNNSGELFYISSLEGLPGIGPKSRVYVGNRDYYQNQLNFDTKGYFIGRPVKNDYTDTWDIPVSIPLTRPSHRIFTVVAVIELPLLRSMYETIKPRSGGVIRLFRNDGEQLVSTPLETREDSAEPNGTAWRKLFSSSLRGTELIKGKNASDQDTLVAWLRMTDFPLALTISSKPDVLGEAWWRFIVFRSILVLILTIVVIVLQVYLFRLIRNQIESRRELEKIARIDTLTGLLNRRYFMERAEEELQRADRYKRPLSVALLDLDHFKLINDRLGHAVGDDVLRSFAHSIDGNLRVSDLMGRVGGEEFVAVMPETAQSIAREICERMRLSINTIHTQNGALSASFGIAEWRGPTESLKELLSRADRAMYAAKKAGRNRVFLESELSSNNDSDLEIPII